jgi:lipoprotein-anchoring transpeptidase ErfK/SrfK
LCAGAVALVLLSPATGAGYAAWEDFTDVAEHWGRAVMRRAYDAGILEGNDGRMMPDGTVTGAQLAAILVRALAAESAAGADPESYGGLPSGAWYYNDAADAIAMGFLPPGTDFDAPVTRETAFRAMLNAFQIARARPDTRSLDSFTDVFEYSRDTRSVMASAVEAGIAAGHNGRLRASGSMTRAELVTALFRAAPLGEDSGGDGAARTVVVGSGAGTVAVSGEFDTVEIAGDGREVTVDGDARRVVVSGRGCTVRILEGAGVEELEIFGDKNLIELGADADALTLYGSGNTFTGGGRIGKAVIRDLRFDMSDPPFEADSLTEERDFGLEASGEPALKAPASLPIGETLSVTLTLAAPLERDCYAQWSLNGEPENVSMIPAGETGASFSHSFTYTKDMPDTAGVTCSVHYVTRDGVVQSRVLSARAAVENHSAEYYDKLDEKRVLSLVKSPYSGDYTTQYAIDHDYKDFEKEIWINAKGHGSATRYLMWVNIATQHVSIFEGSAGNWKLIRSCIVSTGSQYPTPVGVWKTTYKQEGGWTTKAYTVRPVVRFKGGGYAFHSMLYRPNTWTLSDPSIGFPASHGCVRMLQDDIQWVFDNIPTDTTVVVF